LNLGRPMRMGLAALVLLMGADAARAQLGVPIEPFPLTSPEYFVLGPNAANCANQPYPANLNRDGRRGHEVNPSANAEERGSNPACAGK